MRIHWSYDQNIKDTNLRWRLFLISSPAEGSGEASTPPLISQA